ncbi:MAG: bifunctional non-ous end joining protein LigD [Thermoleophilaceae bacterium]|nr:bifunctional non-ous end joining protein LigD [Thermoleophilaceae bacterium]
MARKLEEYERKRDFGNTPEPAGDEHAAAGANRFVIHEHHATRLHWDLRLERDGVLVSWAVPKGIPTDPDENHLAVHTEDHPLEYIDFHGQIPKGNYGAGKMTIFDEGTYDTEKFRDKEVMVTFHGKRVKGRYVLFHTRDKDWMIHRMDPPVDPGREPFPEHVQPMLARLGELPSGKADQSHAYEIKWDGIRAIFYSQPGDLRIESRNLKDITSRWPELRPLNRELGARDAVLDGEIVTLGDDGRPSFQRLQGRMHLAGESAVRRRMKDTPAIYMVFDLLYLDGRSLMALPYTERRERLAELDLNGANWKTPAYHVGDGKALLAASAAQGLEGIVAKRLDCPYTPARRGGGWIKVKNQQRQELVIGGWLPGEGNRSGKVGALLIGYYDTTPTEAKKRGEPQRFLYAGRVGTGFTEATLGLLARELTPLARDTSPFDGRQPPKAARFVEPRLVGEVEFSEWTNSGTIRHPSFKGLREDKDANAVVREGPDQPEQ